MNRRMKQDIVPWKNPAEFIKVYEYAYCDDLAKNRWAVEQMAVWESRCWPSLPTAVEATLLFVRSKIQDKLYEASKSLCHAQEVEMMYSNSVVRFVNLLVENDQNTKSKKRISYLAAERNIPPWIVDIRHSSAHGFNPTLPVLRMAHEAIMAYLEEIFWLPESSRVRSIKRAINETPMINLLQEYRVTQYQEIVNKCDSEKVDKATSDKVLKRIDYVLSKRKSRKTFLKVLVRDFITEDDVFSMVGDDAIFMDPNNVMDSELPKQLRIFYYPMILLLHKHNLISTCLELLLLSQANRKLKVLQKVVDLAVVYVLDLVKGVPLESAKPFIDKGANLNMYRLLYSCVQGCSSSVRTVFERLVKDMNLSMWTEELSVMLNMRMGNTINREQGRKGNQRQKRKFDITFTVEDLEEDMHEEMEINLKKGPWTLAPLSIDWASVPIGHVFHPVDIKKKEEPQHEGETSSVGKSENMYAYASEESKAVERPRPTNFIFKELPEPSCVIYRR